MMKFSSTDQLIRLVSNGNERHKIYIPRSYLLWSDLMEEIQLELSDLPFDGIDCPYNEDDLSNFFSLVESLSFLPSKDTTVNPIMIGIIIDIGLFFKMKKVFWDRLSKINLDKASKNKILPILNSLNMKKDLK